MATATLREERNLDSADFDALEEQARGKLSPAAYAFAAAGADDEITVADNIAAWRRLRLRPRMLNDISTIDTGVSVLGARLASPIMVAPFGRHKLFHPEGERATARGASVAGAVLVLPTTSTISMEEVSTEPGTAQASEASGQRGDSRVRAHSASEDARERAGDTRPEPGSTARAAPRWFQLYLPPDRALTENLIDRAAAAGFRAVVLTVDQPVYGSSPRAARAPLVPSPDIRNANLPGQPIAQNSYKPGYTGRVTFPATWRDLEWLVQRSPLDVLVKGVLRGDDAARCVEAGAKAIIVSNHGGRHLDGTLATAEALPEIAAAIAGKAELYVDGGIRRGTDIVKALALGARAVLVARPVIWGLALDGAAGVTAVLDHLRAELIRSMALCGVARLDDITGDLVAGI
jgi:4-hydroxymandelate oxidase